MPARTHTRAHVENPPLPMPLGGVLSEETSTGSAAAEPPCKLSTLAPQRRKQLCMASASGRCVGNTELRVMQALLFSDGFAAWYM